MKRRLIPVLSALGLVLALATPAFAHHNYGDPDDWFYNSAIGDGNLTVCFEGGTPVYDNRSSMATGYQRWSSAVVLTFTSTGACDGPGDPTNIQIWWGANPNPGYVPQPAWTSCTELGAEQTHNSGYSITHIWINPHCPWDWNGAPIDAGKYDIRWVTAHEVGHALGLNHFVFNDSNRQVMDNYSCGTGNTIPGTLAWDDATSLQNRYPGLTPKSGSWAISLGCIG